MSSLKKVIIKPIIISNRNNRQMVLAPKRMTPNLILSNLKVAAVPMYKEDVIFESSNCDFLKGESQKVLIVNKVNIANKTCRTIAKCTAKGASVETTSDDVCALIGQNNYDTVLSALGSVFNEETKVRGILALLRRQTKHRTTATQTELSLSVKKKYVDTSCQTTVSHPETLGKQKQRRRVRRQNTPYVVKEVKKCVINIDNVFKKEDLKKEVQEEQEEKVPELPDIKDYVDEDSNISCRSNMTSLSMLSHPELLDHRKVQETLDSIQKQTCSLNEHIEVYDGTKIMIPVKPEDEFHIATPDILKNVTNEERIKLLNHQALIDYKRCLEQNEDGYYPLHVAVLHGDVELVRRQALALRWRQESVDKVAGGMTALQMAVQYGTGVECVGELLRRGADPLLGDAERRSALHRAAAAAGPAPLRALLDHCDRHPREVLKNSHDYWKPHLEGMTDQELTTYLYEKIGELFDDQGVTPLMEAAALGRAEAAGLLGARCRPLLDAASPACGATALYRAVAAACVHSKEHGSTENIPEEYLKTAEVLVSLGADPGAETHAGSSVNSLLQETAIPKLSMRIVNAMPGRSHGRPASNMILVRDKDGRIAPERARRRQKLDDDALKKIIEAHKRMLKEDAAGCPPQELPPPSKRKLDTPAAVGAKNFKSEASVSKPKANNAEVMNKLYDFNFNNSCKGLASKHCEVTANVFVDRRSGEKDTGFSVPNNRITGLKFLPGKETKSADGKSRIVIVENVSVNTEFSKMSLPAAAAGSGVVTASKPKDILLVNARRDAGSPKYVRIAPKNATDVDAPAPGTSGADGK